MSARFAPTAKIRAATEEAAAAKAGRIEGSLCNGRYPLCPGASVPAKRGRQPGDPLTPRTAKRGPGGGTESEGEPSEMPSRGPGGA